MRWLQPLPRRVGRETLDHLDENDARAIRSRRDLQRVHRVMRTRSILLRALRQAAALAAFVPGRETPLRMIELGAGDASLMLGVARTLVRQWPHVQLTLLDRQRVVDAVVLQIGSQTISAAETADSDRHALLDGVFRAAGKRQRHVGARGEFCGELARFGGAAEDQDAFHGARGIGIVRYTYGTTGSFSSGRSTPSPSRPCGRRHLSPALRGRGTQLRRLAKRRAA